jgi:hypothetical protein
MGVCCECRVVELSPCRGEFEPSTDRRCGVGKIALFAAAAANSSFIWSKRYPSTSIFYLVRVSANFFLLKMYPSTQLYTRLCCRAYKIKLYSCIWSIWEWM